MSGTPFLAGWREQYDRMTRAYARLATLATGSQFADSNEARDALIGYFQAAYALKDWIINDPAAGVAGNSVESAVKASNVLAICADLANGTKHLRLKTAKTADLSTGFTSQSVTVRPATIRVRASVGASGKIASVEEVPDDGPLPPLHRWEVTSNGVTYDALTLGRDVVAAWEAWLRREGLL